MSNTFFVHVPVDIESILSEFQKVEYSKFIRKAGNEYTTFSGKKINPLSFKKSDVSIVDIAHGLSNLCRFGGQCREFYSVAEHSVLMSIYIEHVSKLTGLPLCGLLHDATKAYLVDVPKPFKILFPGYNLIEKNFANVISEAFGLGFSLESPILKECDHRLYLRERDHLFDGASVPGSHSHLDLENVLKIQCLSPSMAKKAFLERAEELGVVVRA